MNALSIFRQKEIPVTVTGMLLSAGKVPVTESTVQNDLLNHPDYPSLLCISDVLHGYGVDNIAFVCDPEKLEDMPLPFIAQVKSEYTFQDLFVMVRSVDNGSVVYYEPEIKKWKKLPGSKFIEQWPSRIALMADASSARGEHNYARQRMEESRANAIKYISWLALPVLVLLAGILRFARSAADVVPSLAYFLLTLAGAVAGVLLLWYELGEYNPVLQKICSAGKKVNCGAVLNSKAARLAGIGWSTIGFTYFAGGLFVMLFTRLSHGQVWFILSWLNVLACPYVIFSIYYQWRVARQWCVLCLSVQGLLILQLLTALLAGWHFAALVNSVFTPEVALPVVFSFIIPFVVINLLMPLYRKAKESRQYKIELQRLKQNPLLFESLLSKQDTYPVSPDGLGITIGNPNARHKIVKICNPYCGPCSKSHAELHHLLDNNPDLQLQIVFHTTNNEKDPQRLPVKHLLAINEFKDEALIEQALDDWYLPATKDLETFVRKYPVPDEWKDNESKLREMSAWIASTGATSTPTVYVNGRRLPANYAISDLKYFLSV